MDLSVINDSDDTLSVSDNDNGYKHKFKYGIFCMTKYQFCDAKAQQLPY